ncbi:MAG: type II toxin-antitoxin system antitoxin SocA domain-containing protein [Lysobacteraceae bacterium]
MNNAIKKGHSSLSVAQYIIDHCATTGIDTALTPMKILKLVYLAHGWMLGIHSRPLVSEEVEAWTYGPVIPQLYRAMRPYKASVVDCINGADDVVFDDEERDVIAQVCEMYGRHTGPQLSQLTHKNGSPWDLTWSTQGKSGLMSNDLIEQHYSQLAHAPLH